jgi:hypothetical protein
LVIAVRRLRAPKQHGAVVAIPPLGDASQLIAANRQLLEKKRVVILGRDLADLRAELRASVAAIAEAYLRQAGEPIPSRPGEALFMAGHQPELFHPGVWVKNFLLNGLARSAGATPINLIVDNDTAKNVSLRVPLLGDGSPESVRLEQVPFDRWSGELPYEEHEIQDENLFRNFPKAVEAYTRVWPFKPLLQELWQQKGPDNSRFLGERLVAARRALERRWGCHNLELPVSVLCRSEAFAWFALQLLSELPRFHAVHNECVQEYRRVYGLRSRNHPVPDLGKDGDWLEAPFWTWHARDRQRRRLFARQTTAGMELRLGNERPMPVGLDRNKLSRALPDWQELEAAGFKVRSRALTNAIFARLFLCDIFLHGIGGAKYDELTDEIIRRFYECEPPGYLVLTATLLLPFQTFPCTAERHRLSGRNLRDLHWNPDRHLNDPANDVASLVREKQISIAGAAETPAERRARFWKLRELTERLRPFVAAQRETEQQQLRRCTAEVEANGILLRRDYAFCLYPEALLRPFCAEFLNP